MQKTIKIGIFSFPDGKRHSVYCTLSLKQEKEKIVFSCVGEIKRFACGQCYNSIESVAHDDKKWQTIYRLWKLYHLNNMHAGTPKQEEALKDCPLNDFDARCQYLKSINLYEDEGYRYGSSWLYQPIPEADLRLIQKMINGGKKQ